MNKVSYDSISVSPEKIKKKLIFSVSAVVDFIEFATKSGNIELQMEEIPIEAGSSIENLTIEKSGIGRDLGIIIVAIKRADGYMEFNPLYNRIIKEGDTLIALGDVSKLKILEKQVVSCRLYRYGKIIILFSKKGLYLFHRSLSI